MYEVEFISKRVKKEFDSFGTPERTAIIDAMQMLRTNPRPAELDFGHVNRCSDIKRIKVGRVRVFYIINGDKIWIGKLENRDTGTYKIDPKEWFRRSA